MLHELYNSKSGQVEWLQACNEDTCVQKIDKFGILLISYLHDKIHHRVIYGHQSPGGL